MSARKRSLAVLAICSLVLTGACAQGGGGGAAGDTAPSGAADTPAATEYVPPKITVGTAEDSAGPAIPPEGVVKGGTVTMIDRDDFSHLDPGRVYINSDANFQLLISRGLTGYKRVAKNEYKLVGDLATDAGTPSDGGRTWTFTLKDGVKWQDGSPITAEDIKWSIERLFADFITEGPPYIQQWLVGSTDYKKKYQGPYEGERLDAIETPDDKTIVFKFTEPHPDANFALAMTGYSAVPKAKDTKERYDKAPFSSGPYIITSHVVDKSYDLERNPHWDPATDPIRGAYPDRWRLEFGQEALQITDRFIADTGNDKTALSFYAAVAPERIQQVLKDESLKPRLMRQASPYSHYYLFNMDRVKDIKIRQAINYAWPSEQIRTINGGPAAAVYSTTILNPAVVGWQDYDLFGLKANPKGDPEKAKEILATSSNPNPTIVYAYNQTPTEERITVAIKNALAKAGINVVAKPLDRKTYYDSIGKVDNQFDMYWAGWGADWPTGATVFPVIFGPIGDGMPNYSHLNEPEVTAEIERIQKIDDPDEAAKAWGDLDRMIMEKFTPLVPALNEIFIGLHGSLVGGAEVDPLNWTVSPNRVFVKNQ